MHKLIKGKVIGLVTVSLLFVLVIFYFLQPFPFHNSFSYQLKISGVFIVGFSLICFILIRIWQIRRSVIFLINDMDGVVGVNHSLHAQIRIDSEGKIKSINSGDELNAGWAKRETFNQYKENKLIVMSADDKNDISNIANRNLEYTKVNHSKGRDIRGQKDSFAHFVINKGKMLLANKANITGGFLSFKKMKAETIKRKIDSDIDKNYWNLMEQASDAIIIGEMDGSIIKVNESFHKLLGYSPRAVKSMNISHLFKKEYLLKDPLRFDVIQEGKNLVRERVMSHRDGSNIDVEVNVKMIEGGRLVTIIRDIAERKLAEASVRKSNERFELIGRATNDALWEWNLETGELWANQVHQELYGRTLEDPVPIESEWKSLLHPDDKNGLIESIALALASDKNTWSGEYRMRVNDDWAYIFGQTYIVRNDEGRPVILMGNMTDITLRKIEEEKTRLAMERYDILARATSDTIWDWDVESDSMVYNDGIYHMFGYEQGVDNLIKWWNEKIHPDDIAKVNGKVEAVFENKQERFQLLYRFRCADGSYKNIFDRAFALFDAEGKPYRVIGAMQDVTYIVQEDARLGKAIMDAQEQERQYIGAELHDNVNQILAGALLVLGMVKADKTNFTEALEYLETGKGYVNNAIQEVRKLSHELAPASFEECQLQDAFENLLLAFNVDNRFSIRANFDEQCNILPEEIQINLYRILQEQLKNIVKHAEATEIGISTTHMGSVVLLIISDNGKGFNPKLTKKGIGLGNIKKRASLLSGKCNIKANEGEGCTISVEIPIELQPLQSKSNDHYDL